MVYKICCFAPASLLSLWKTLTKGTGT